MTPSGTLGRYRAYTNSSTANETFPHSDVVDIILQFERVEPSETISEINPVYPRGLNNENSIHAGSDRQQDVGVLSR